MARPCLRCQAPSSRGRQNGTAAVDPPCTCRFINGTTRHRGSFSSALPLGSLRGAWFFFVATARRSMRADSGSFVQMRRQSPCQYVNYCLRSFPCLCATPLAVRLFARTSSSLCRTSYPFISLLLYRLRALSCAFTKSLAVRLSSHASPLLQSYFFTTAPELLPICKLLPAVFSLPLRKFPRCPPPLSRLAAAPIVFFHHCSGTLAERRVRRARG